MVNVKSFVDQVDELKYIIEELDSDHPPEAIERTAARLEGLNYAPAVVTPNHSFLRITKSGLLAEIDRILALPDDEACALAPDDTKKCEDIILQTIIVLLFYYEKLLLLRNGDADEWDEVDELYVHD